VGDEYLWIYIKKPTERQVLERLYQLRGQFESLKYYRETTDIDIQEHIVIGGDEFMDEFWWRPGAF